MDTPKPRAAPAGQSPTALSPMPRLADIVHRATPWVVLGLGTILLPHLANTQSVFEQAWRTGNWPMAHGQWMVLPAACATALASAWFMRSPYRAVAGAGALALASVLALPGAPWLLPLLIIPFAIILFEIYSSLKLKSPWRPDIIAMSLLTLLITFAAYRRQELFFLILRAPEDPDLGGYIKIAQEHRGWNTTYREPLYIWVLQLVNFLGGTLNPMMARLTSVATSFVAIAAIFELCRRHLNLGVAIIAALFYADQKFMIYTAGRGLREDLIVALTMFFLLYSWTFLHGPIRWHRLALWGLLGAACALLRFSSFSLVLLAFAGIAAWRLARNWRDWKTPIRILLPATLTIILFAPYMLHCKKLYGQPLFLANWAARFYANEEFGGVRPDFPTREELARDAYAGPVITPREYVFNYHTPSEIASRIWAGFTKTFFGLNFRVAFNLIENASWGGILMLFHFAGIALLLFPRRIFLIAAMLVFHAPIFFLAERATFDPRLLIIGMVFCYISIASGLALSAEYAFHFIRSKPLSDTSAPITAPRPRRARNRR